MHTALFSRLGLDAVYLAFDVHPDRADRVADAIRTLDLCGVNLTVPFKERVTPSLDHATQAVREAGSSNVVTNVDGELTGYNTDGEGLVRAVEEEHGWKPLGRRCLVLGAGGAGRAVAASRAAAGAERVCLLNRTVGRAESAAEHLAGFGHPAELVGRALHPDVVGEEAPTADLVVNCLGAGAEGLVETFDVLSLPDRAVWVDTNYWMRVPPALEACRRRGLRTSTGLGMLIHQGALTFELFTGHPIEARELRTILGDGRLG